MPVDDGTQLGAATGRINIDTSGLQTVRAVSQQVGQQTEQNLARIGAGAAKAQAGIAGLGAGAVQAQGGVSALSVAAVRGQNSLSAYAAAALAAHRGVSGLGAAAHMTSVQLNAAIAAAARLSNTKYMIANAPAPN